MLSVRRRLSWRAGMAEPPATPWRDLTRKRNGRIPEVLDSLGKNMEKRLPIAIFVNLAPAQNRNGTELTYTENVSAHGACVVSNRPWQPGSHCALGLSLPCTERLCICRKWGEDRYAIGVSFPQGEWFGPPTSDTPASHSGLRPSSTGPADSIIQLSGRISPRRRTFTLPAFFPRSGVVHELQATRPVAHFLFRALSAG